MSLITSPILKSVDLTKAQKSNYLENEILKKKKIINYTHTKGYFIAKNNLDRNLR